MIGFLLGGGCGDSEDTIPRQRGPLVLRVRNIDPTSRAVGDSIALWGTIGTGDGHLVVNGRTIAVAPNGTFATIVASPLGDPVTLTLLAVNGPDTIREAFTVPREAPSAATPLVIGDTSGWVRLRRPPSDTADAATQARPIYTRWLPAGPLAIAIPQETTWPIDAIAGDAVRLRLSDDLAVWAPRLETMPVRPPGVRRLEIGQLRHRSEPDRLSIQFPIQDVTASTIDVTRDSLIWTLYRASSAHGGDLVLDDSLIAGARIEEHGDGRVSLRLALAAIPHGWRDVIAPGVAMLELRRPRPPGLAGLRVAIDAGHPPGGATGPGGLREDSLVLAVAREVHARLARLGAVPFLVRADEAPMSLDARIARASLVDAEVFVSLHADAPGNGRAPEDADRTTTYWWRPGAGRLANAIFDSLWPRVGARGHRVVRTDFAVLRPTWYHAVLVEPTTLVLPHREAQFRTTHGIEAYAEGVVRGIVAWAETPTSPRSPAQ